LTQSLTVEQIELGRAEILNNARALIEEAEILLHHERWARAYALSHLASEELAKLPMLVRAAVEVACGASVDWKGLHTRLRDHVEKAELAMDMDFLSGHMPPDEYLNTRAAHLNHLKNDSFYVGISAGRFVAPVQAISREAAVAMCETSRRRLRLFGSVEKLTRGQIQRVASNPEHRNRLSAKGSLQDIVRALAAIERGEPGGVPANSALQQPGARDAHPGC
jgi:AbiV family abortive infection protein